MVEFKVIGTGLQLVNTTPTSSVQITLTNEQKRFMESQAATRGFENPSEYVCALLEADRLPNVRGEIEEVDFPPMAPLAPI